MGEKLTPARRRALQRAIDNGGTIELGGLDGDGIRYAVIRACCHAGWLEWEPPPLGGGQPWRITEAGRRAIQQGEPTT